MITETREIKAFLAWAFPGVIFKAKSQKGYGGYLEITWIDGPSAGTVCQRLREVTDRSIMPDRRMSARAILEFTELFERQTGQKFDDEKRYNLAYDKNTGSLCTSYESKQGLALSDDWFTAQEITAN